jgi:ubiquinone/menaquinone biosynthesis C-methylase UbiE
MNEQVRNFWEQEPCGTGELVTGGIESGTLSWFEEIERNRYEKEPMIHGVAEFVRHRGKKLLEIGVGAGTDHLQWARAGCICTGVDLTDAGIQTTRRRLELYGFSSDLRRVDAERLPFEDNTFDIVWSWGVVHHAEYPDRILAEIHRVLKPGGEFRGMMYKRYSLAVFNEWLKHALLKGRPWRTFTDVLASHFESPGTKAYTLKELNGLLAQFSDTSLRAEITPYDVQHLPRMLRSWMPNAVGSFIDIRAVK